MLGYGFAAEALTFLVEWALAQSTIWRAWAFCDVENPGSVRVMEKAGMVREGVLRRWHVCPTLGPEPRDCIVCAKVR
ncbi:MAG: N-acetyltransferase [Opitutus sp.]|nr:N-acetyltransferase [Opitutus sp.]